MIAFKAVNKDMTPNVGKNITYQIGKTYIFPMAQRAAGGFHAAEDPMFCLNFIKPQNGRYFKVELQGRLDAAGGPIAGGDTAAAAEKITLLQELTVPQMLWHSLQYRLMWTNKQRTESSNDSNLLCVALKDNQTVISRGQHCIAVAKGKNSTAIAEGYKGTAIAEGDGAHCEARELAVAFGRNTTAVSKYGYAIRIIPDETPENQIQILSQPQ